MSPNSPKAGVINVNGFFVISTKDRSIDKIHHRRKLNTYYIVTAWPTATGFQTGGTVKQTGG